MGNALPLLLAAGAAVLLLGGKKKKKKSEEVETIAAVGKPTTEPRIVEVVEYD